MKLKKYHYHVLMINISCFDDKYLFQTMKFIRLLIFRKIVLQAVKKFKKVVLKRKRLKKVVIKKKRLKKVVIIEKDCDNRKRL